MVTLERSVLPMLLLVLHVPINGCSGKVEVDSKVQREKSELTEIGEMYMSYLRSTQRPPRQLSDLNKKEYEMIHTAGFHALHKGRYIAVWGVNTKDADTVLVYEKDVPKNGGAVLMADGAYKNMTAEEFKAAKK